nr:hypothetical protein [Tanacetum cinerariifolium]
MADVNVNALADQAPTMAPPTRTDDQILPHIRWVPIGKRNCYLDVEKSQSNLIYKIEVDILKHTNFFRAFTASLTIPSIYIQQFWDTVRYDKTRKHKFHPRPDSPLHFPNEELVLGYLKFSAKGTKREDFGMPIPESLEKVAKHQRYLAGEKGSDHDSPAPKPAKVTKKSQPSVPKAYLRPPITKLASSQQPEPKPTPVKSKGKKHKLPSPTRRSKPGLVIKRRKPTSSLRSVDEFVDEGISEKEPRFDDEETDVRGVLEESLKSIYDAPRGPLPPMVIREPESGKYQPLPEVQGKGKEKVTDEQAGPNSGEKDEGQAGPNPGAAASQPQSSLVVHAGPNLEHMDLDVTDVSTQPHPKQMDEGFTASAYPKVQENLKLTVEEQVILKERLSSTGTLSSLQHLAKDLSFSDLFFNDKPSEADNEKTTA